MRGPGRGHPWRSPRIAQAARGLAGGAGRRTGPRGPGPSPRPTQYGATRMYVQKTLTEWLHDEANNHRDEDACATSSADMAWDPPRRVAVRVGPSSFAPKLGRRRLGVQLLHGRAHRMYVLFFIEFERRPAWLSRVTAHPTGEWVTQQARHLTMALAERAIPGYPPRPGAVWQVRGPSTPPSRPTAFGS